MDRTRRTGRVSQQRSTTQSICSNGSAACTPDQEATSTSSSQAGRKHDIYSAITRWATNDSIVPLQSTLVKKDISSYIKWEVSNREGLQRWEGNQTVQQEIESALIEKAGGM